MDPASSSVCCLFSFLLLTKHIGTRAGTVVRMQLMVFKGSGGHQGLWKRHVSGPANRTLNNMSFYCLDGEPRVLSKCFSSKVTSVICQLHASVFSMRLHFGAHKGAVLYVHCKMWYSGVKQCARNGSLITTWLRFSDSVLSLAPGCLHSVLLIYQLFYTAHCIITQKQTVSSRLK